MGSNGTRTARLEIRLTPEEREAFQKAADAEGLSVADWLRAAGLTRIRIDLSGTIVQAREIRLPPRSGWPEARKPTRR